MGFACYFSFFLSLRMSSPSPACLLWRVYTGFLYLLFLRLSLSFIYGTENAEKVYARERMGIATTFDKG